MRLRPRLPFVQRPGFVNAGPGFVMLNLRLGKAFEFGAMEGANAASGQNRKSRSEHRRYSLSFSAHLRNILNHNNPGPIIGDITSPLFGAPTRAPAPNTLEALASSNRPTTGAWKFRPNLHSERTRIAGESISESFR